MIDWKKMASIVFPDLQSSYNSYFLEEIFGQDRQHSADVSLNFII